MSSRISAAAVTGATLLNLQESDIITAVLELGPGNFYKSMESEQCPGLWQDVYHLRYRCSNVYIKLQLDFSGAAVVIQFKER